ncbi:DNA-binding GntR family transcriptional regulator [Rhizobium sp. BK313]|nr:DNA-binding GntR family transcriptional regulator [Rhizobium sp. BK313]
MAGRDKASRAYLDIKAVLLSHRVPPSTFLNIKSLAEALRLSATPVREALVRLAQEDIIFQAPLGRGYFSRAFRIDELASEFEAARLIASYTLVEQRDRVASELFWTFAVDGNAPSSNLFEHSLLIERFHLRLGELSQNLRFQRVMEVFVERSRFIRLHDLSAPGRLEEVGEVMRDLKRSIEADEMDAAVEILREQTKTTIGRLPDMMQEILRRAIAAGLSAEAALVRER